MKIRIKKLKMIKHNPKKERKLESKTEENPNNIINNNHHNDTIIWDTKDTKLHTKENI